MNEGSPFYGLTFERNGHHVVASWTAQMTTTEQRPAVPTAPSWFNVDAVAPRAVRDACKRRTRPLRSCRTKPRLVSPGAGLRRFGDKPKAEVWASDDRESRQRALVP